MRKLLGAASILLACFWAALGRLRDKKQSIAHLHALAQSLLELRSALQERQQGLGGMFMSLAQKYEKGPVRGFYGRLNEKLEDLGEYSFSELWRGTAEECFSALGEGVVDNLCPLGDCLGGSELDRQCTALERAAQRIEKEAETRREALGGEKRLSFGLSLCAGGFLAIMLM